MRSRITKLAAALAALAALAVGGASLATAGSTGSPPVGEAPAAVDLDQVAQGDQATPDTAASEEPESGTAESSSEPADNDGPGGHADEPGNPNANHEFEGEE